MKYNIFINQKAFVENFTGLDVIDAAVMDFIMGMCNSERPGMKRIVPPGEDCDTFYTWLNIKNMINEMPLLGIKDRSAAGKRIHRLERAGLIRMYIAPENTMYIRLTQMAGLLIFDRGARAETAPVGLCDNRARDESLQHNTIINNNIYSESEDSPSKTNKKKEHEEVKLLFDFYLEGFNKLISHTPPVFNWGQCEKLAKPLIKRLGIDKMKELMVYYFKSDDKFYRDNAWSLSCFLSTKIIHRLQQLKK